MPHGPAVALACKEAGEEFVEIGSLVSTLADNYRPIGTASPDAPLKANDFAAIKARLGSPAAKKVAKRIAAGALTGNETYHVSPNFHGQHWY